MTDKTHDPGEPGTKPHGGAASATCASYGRLAIGHGVAVTYAVHAALEH